MDTIPVWLWVLGVVILGGVMVYGITRNRQRSEREKAVSQAATKKLYEQEDRSA